MLHFYDGQIRRYITQMVRMMSNFAVQDGKGNEKIVPVTYGDLSRQVAHIIRENSENAIPSAPRMALYVTGLEMDRTRTSDKTYSNKRHVRERFYNEEGNEYLNYEGKNYTVERLMPAPYTLSVNVDLWTTNTDQKLQILEQVLVLFNPSLEIQTTDNYIDWASLTVVDLENIVWSSRSIPTGTDSEIDVATLSFKTPIYISAPVKVKRLGVITNIITSIFDEQQGTIDLGLSSPIINAFDDNVTTVAIDTNNTRATTTTVNIPHKVKVSSYEDYGIYVSGNIIQLTKAGTVGQENWRGVLNTYPGIYQADISRIFLFKADSSTSVTGTLTLNELNETQIIVNWDVDSFPDDTVIAGKTTIDYIIDPQRINPTELKTLGLRVLLLADIGSEENTQGPIAWKNNDSSDFIASENDIIEWDGTKWNIVFDASTTDSVTYTTNLNTGVQYRWNGNEWLLSIEGEYPAGSWLVKLAG